MPALAGPRAPGDDAPLRTERLVLEPLVEAHAARLFASFADPLLYTYIPGDPPASIDVLRERYRRLEKRASPDGTERWLNWAARLVDAPSYVGLIEATAHADATASLAYFVFSAHGRRGYGVEAAGVVVDHLFESHRVRTVRANIDTRNLAAIRLVKRLGFLQERLVLQADRFKDTVSDEWVFARTHKTIDPSGLP
jgi:RimJ/RimL family protein N-acetyltransferase